MKRLAIARMSIIAVLLGSTNLYEVGATHAETFKYICKDGGRSYPLKVSDKLEWRGLKYEISDANAEYQEHYDPDHPENSGDPACAKGGWHVTGNGKAFDFCYATKGYADFDLDGKHIPCNQKR